MIFVNGLFLLFFLQLVRVEGSDSIGGPMSVPSIDINNIIISTAILLCFIAHACAYRGPRPQPRQESGPVETGPTVPVATALILHTDMI